MRRRTLRKGAEAVEVALIAPVLFALVFIMIDFGLQLFTQATLEASTQAVARQMQIGAIRGSTSQTAQDTICQRMSSLVSSCAGIQIYATSAPTFSVLAPATLSGNSLSTTTWTPGNSHDMVLLQVAYYRPYSIPVNGVTGQVILCNVAFQNEL